MKDLSKYSRMEVLAALRIVLINSMNNGKPVNFIWKSTEEALEISKKIKNAKAYLHLSDDISSSNGTSMGRIHTNVMGEDGLFNCFVIQKYQSAMTTHYITISLLDIQGELREWTGSVLDLYDEVMLYLHVMTSSPEFEEIEK